MLKDPAIMRYHKNSFSYILCLLAIVFNICYFAFALEPIMEGLPVNIGMTIALDVVINIVFMLFTFLGGEKIKTYDIKWNFIVFVMGIAEILRIFIVPNLEYVLVNSEEFVPFITGIDKTLSIIFLIAAGACLIVASIIGYQRAVLLHKYLKEEAQ